MSGTASSSFRNLSRGARAGGVVAAAIGAVSSSLAGALPSPGFPGALGVQLKPDNFNAGTLEQAQALGFRVVRRGFYWNAVEKEKGVYNFEGYDAPMARAKELGLTVVACLFGGNRLYEDHGRGGVLTEEGRQGFARFAAAAAARYKGQPVVWEIWNEPNVRTFWRKDGTHNSREFAEEYTALVAAVMPAMLAADPEALVLAGSVSNYWEPSYQWTDFCFRNGILATGIRGWSVHPYGVKTPEEHAGGHARMRELLARHGAPGLPLFNTERGYSVKETAEGWSGGSKARAREYQAWHFARQALIDQLHGLVFSVWYEWGGEEFGLADADGPRPIQEAVRTLATELAGCRVTKRLDADSPQDYLLLCEKDDGSRKLAAWTAPPPGGSPDEIWDHDVALEMGRGLPALALKLTGNPQYVALPREAAPGRSVTTSARPVARTAATMPPGATDLKLFEPGARWTFIENTGAGSFELGKDADGTPVGVLAYDFSRSKSQSRPYVLASVPVTVTEGAKAIQLHARSDIAMQLTFRLTDSTGQTLQHKTRLKGTGSWEPIRIPLDRKLEHWGGANDGLVHFPLKSLVLSVPLPGEEHKKGKVEYAAAAVITGDTPAPAPAPAAAPPPAKPAGTLDLGLFDGNTEWKFMKNTGEGSFAVTRDADGRAIGTLTFDFTRSAAAGTPYVLATAPVSIPAGCTEIVLEVRTAIPQRLTFRVTDSTGQTLQHKTQSAGTGRWEEIRIPLDRKLEHWGGANDGFVHFPLTAITFSVPRPGPGTPTGKVEYSNVRAR